MIIKNISIKNFRSYYGYNDFAISEGLTLIIGGNGDGKTTFFEALEWLFNTSSTAVIQSHISEKRKSELAIGESDEIAVSIKFEHDGPKEVTKSFVFERKSADSVVTRDFCFIGYEQFGVERVQVSGKTLLDRCFDAETRKYCLFKGESELNVFDNKEALHRLVDTFSGIRQFNELVEYAAECEDKSGKAYSQETKKDDKIARQAKDLDSQRREISETIRDLRRDIQDKEAAINNSQLRIDSLEKYQETSETYQEIKKRIAGLNDKRARIAGHLKIDFNTQLLDEYWILRSFSPILTEFQKKTASFSKQKRNLDRQDVEQKAKAQAVHETVESIQKIVGGKTALPWNLPDKETMEEMIEDEVCKVCGRPAPKGSEAYEFMVHKLDEYLKHIQAAAEAQQNKLEDDKPLFPHSFIEELHARQIKLSGDEEKWIATLKYDISDTLSFIHTRKLELKKIDKEIQEATDEKSRLLTQTAGLTEEELDKSFANFKGFLETKARDERRLDELNRKLTDALRSKKEIDDAFAELKPNNKMAQVYQRMHHVLRMILEAIEQAKENNVTEFLRKLEEEANRYFRILNKNDFSGIIKIVRTINESARIELTSANGTLIQDPGGAQKTTMYMSVLFAISNITTLKRKQDYPLIFDAPTSSFEDYKEDVFYNVIDKIDKQCIIVTKDLLITDESTGEKKLNNAKINQLTCSVYRIAKAHNYNPLDLATIQTIITPIKTN